MASFKVGSSSIHGNGLFLKSDSKTYAAGSSLGVITPTVSLYSFVGGLYSSELDKVFGAQARAFESPAAAMVDRIYTVGPACVAKLIKYLNGKTPTLDNVLKRTKGPDPEGPDSEMRVLHASRYKEGTDYGDHGLVLTAENGGYPLTRALYEVVLNFNFAVDDPLTGTMMSMQIYDLLAFVNHSCDPNIYVQSDGGKVTLVALREIKPGEEITRLYSFNQMLMHYTALPGVKETHPRVNKVDRAFIDRGAFDCTCGSCFKVAAEVYNSNGYAQRVTKDKKKHEMQMHDRMCAVIFDMEKDRHVESVRGFRELRRGALKNVAKLNDPITLPLVCNAVICAAIKLVNSSPSDEVIEVVTFAANKLLELSKDAKFGGLERDMQLRAHLAIMWAKFFTVAGKAMKITQSETKPHTEIDEALGVCDREITATLVEQIANIELLMEVPAKVYMRYVALISNFFRAILKKFPVLGNLNLVPDDTYGDSLSRSIGGEKSEPKNTAAELTEFEK